MLRTSRTIPALLLAAAAVAAGCGGITKGKDDADRAVAEFHAQFNQGRFEGIWDAAGEDLRKGISQQEFSALLAAVRRKLGDATGSSTRSWNVSSRNLATYVVLVQDTTFATGKGTETFQFVVKDGRATLVGYDISSRDLILR
jgi:hypothetical protein